MIANKRKRKELRNYLREINKRNIEIELSIDLIRLQLLASALNFKRKDLKRG